MQSNRRVGALVALLALAACGAAVTTPDTSVDRVITVEGPLTLTVSDAPAQPGVLFIAGAVAATSGAVTMTSTRYGSVCSTAIAAHATVSGGLITLRVAYSERAAICTQDIRAVTYRADLTDVAPAIYDVRLVHTNSDGASSTVLTQRVTVP